MSAQPEQASPGENSLDSFVVRFVRGPEAACHPSAPWHGIIRHVQSNRERAFSRWEDATSFINEFVSLTQGTGEA